MSGILKLRSQHLILSKWSKIFNLLSFCALDYGWVDVQDNLVGISDARWLEALSPKIPEEMFGMYRVSQ